MKRLVLNLSNSVKCKNLPNIPYKTFTLSGGKEHIEIDPIFFKNNGKIDGVTILSPIENSSDFMKTISATDAIKSLTDAKIDYLLHTSIMPDKPFSSKIDA